MVRSLDNVLILEAQSLTVEDETTLNNLTIKGSLTFSFFETGNFTPTFTCINPDDDGAFAAQINFTYISRIGRWSRAGNALTIFVECEWTNQNNGVQTIGIALQK